MSAFDENPFGEPKIDNPFADPSVSRAAASSAAPSAAAPGPALEDYNPFDGSRQTVGQSQPAVMSPTQDQAPAGMQPPPAYTQTGQQQISTSDFQRRQEELDRRAKDLERREEELRNTPYNARNNNWPPLPSFCPVQPCFYQDINVDIPVEFQKIVRWLYYLWLLHFGLLFWNVFVSFMYLFTGEPAAAQMVGLSILYLLLFTPASFLCWFRPAYKAFRDDSSVSFMVFFFIFFFQACFSVIVCLGISSAGGAGFINAFTLLSNKGGYTIFVGVLMLVSAIGWVVAACADTYLLLRIHKLYRSTGASFAKAQSEFMTSAMKNDAVQQAAAQAASSAVRSQFAAAQSGGANGQPPPPPAGRY